MKKLLLLTSLLVSAGAWADRVTFNNGDVLTGEVSSVSGGQLVIATEYAPRIVVSMEHVAQIFTDGDMTVYTGAGERLVGRLTANEGGLAVERQGQAVNVTDVTKVVKGIEITGTDADWAHRADFAATMSNGNANTESYSLLTESKMRRGIHENVLNTAVFKDKDSEVTTRDELDIDYSYRRFISDQWFFVGNGEYFRDTLKNIDPRITVGAGAGYRFWENSLGSLTVEFGLSAVYEDLGVEDTTNPAARWALDYRRLLAGERMEFFHRHQILKIIDSDRGEVLDSSTGLRFMLNDWWDANVRADVRHETEVPPGSHKTDVTYAVGVGVRF